MEVAGAIVCLISLGFWVAIIWHIVLIIQKHKREKQVRQ